MGPENNTFGTEANMNSTITIQPPRVDRAISLYKFHTTADVLRLDEVHPVISGNKWFKLQHYLTEANSLGKKVILTFGGAFSNHIVATAAAAKAYGFASIGIIRGERGRLSSPTLIDAEAFGMDLQFLPRDQYRIKQLPLSIFNSYALNDVYMIAEGGYGKPGASGAMNILDQTDAANYTHIIAAVGTGTMLAGLTLASLPHQQVLGIPVLKNCLSLQEEINALLPADKYGQYSLNCDYHFGGYAKRTPELIHFMNEWYNSTGIPSDFVYTGKLFFAVQDLARKNYFPSGSRLLIIHSGGLQGNRSLPKQTLIF
jgi:1-aminocyclopropane-1-carboxylate deaminase